jgi:peptidoglycan/xylan/chitin deacetylase (PgdA/CDA1 family)
VKRGLSRVADATLAVHGPLDRLASDVLGDDHLVAMFGHLCDEPRDEVRRKLRFLGSKFEFLPLSDALERLRRGTLPRRAAVFTVDDVTREFLDGAADVLVEAGMPFALAPIPGLMPGEGRHHRVSRLMRVAGRESSRTVAQVREAWAAVAGEPPPFDTYTGLFRALDALPIAALDALRERLGLRADRFATWDDLRSLQRRARVELLSHSMSHPMMCHASDEWLDYELGESRRAIERNLGVEVRHFVFPYGESRGDEALGAALRRHGYEGALLVRYGTITPATSPYALPRVGFDRPLGLLNLLTSKVLLRVANRRGAGAWG